jgi:hypothetical protein
MRVEVLYFGGCPTYETATKTLRLILAEEGVESEIKLVEINDDEEAQRLRFPGSPTVRVDGRDLFPVPEREDWRLGCRVYATPEGLRSLGTRSAGWFRNKERSSWTCYSARSTRMSTFPEPSTSHSRNWTGR